MNDEEKPKKKILVLGDYGVGKTSLIKQCINEDFDDQYLTTLGVNIALKDISIRFGGEKADVDVELELWDIAGNKSIADVKRDFYKNGDGAIIVADLSKDENIDKCELTSVRCDQVSRFANRLLKCHIVQHNAVTNF